MEINRIDGGEARIDGRNEAFSYFRLKSVIFPLLLALLAVRGEPLIGSPQDAIRTADLIMAGDMVAGNSVSGGNVVDCTATVHPVRILKGEAGFVSRDVQVHWQYRLRLDGVMKETTSTRRALWFLKKGEDELYEAMWVDLSQDPMGGYFEPIPEGEPTGAYAYSPEATLDRKLAGELGFAMETIARVAVDRLIGVYRTAGSGDGNPYNGFLLGSPTDPASEQRVRFQVLTSLYRELDPASVREVNLYLMSRPQIHLKAVGLTGELRAKSVDALVTMERFYPELAAIGQIGFSLLSEAIDIGGSDAAIRAVGRMCVSEPRLDGFDQFGVAELARAKSRTAMPYLVAMLANSDKRIQESAAGGICDVIAADAKLMEMRDSTLIRACSWATVFSNRIGDHHDARYYPQPEGPRVDFLREWIGAHASEIPGVTTVRP